MWTDDAKKLMRFHKWKQTHFCVLAVHKPVLNWIWQKSLTTKISEQAGVVAVVL
jgi:hypothetical protein